LNPAVTTIEQIYRENLALLVSEAGNQQKLSERIGKSPAQISQWLNASTDSKTGKPRAMSRNMARELEHACKKPVGWMDQQHGQQPTSELSAEEQRLIRGFRSADPVVQNYVLRSLDPPGTMPPGTERPPKRKRRDDKGSGTA
jgi:DNA-binding transcriptional regulator YdaS (Cro superfamily)